MIYPRIARLNSDGTTDYDFDVGVGADQSVLTLVQRPDGPVIAGGSFSTMSGESRPNLAVLNEDGSLVETDLGANGDVNAIVLQADGKSVVAGNFATLGGEARAKMGRLTSSFTVETAFAPTVETLPVYALALQEDGKILVGGAFDEVNGETREGMARLYNDTAVDTLSVVDVSEVFWERAGSSPQLQAVAFYTFAPGDPDWVYQGAGVQESGGWRLTGLSLPSEGDLQARGFPHSVTSQGAVDQTISFVITPEIQVEQPAGTALVDGVSVITFPTTQTGVAQLLTFTIRNVGLDDLDLTGPTPVTFTTGTDFTIVAQPSPLTLAPGETVTFQVQFQATTAGTKADSMFIASNDAVENPFRVGLSGVATPGPGSRDTTFQPVANGSLLGCAEDPSNRIVFGGSFTTFNSVVRNRAARTSALAAIDSGFAPSFNGIVNCAAVQEDGQILVGGLFTTINGTTRRRLTRITNAGTVDTSFNPNPTTSSSTQDAVNSLDINSAGQILVAGEFTTIAGATCSGVAVLSPSGTIVRAITGVANSGVYPRLARFQTDGKIVVAGATAIYRFLTSGVLDFSTTINGQATALDIQTDGKILVGGNFTSIGGQSRQRFARLNDDGTTDTDFTCNANGGVSSINLQADGSVLVMGAFTTLGGESVARIARVIDGVVDETFVSSVTAGNIVSGLVQEDGKVIILGEGLTVEGSSVRAARLTNGEATESLSIVSQTAVQWLRGGTSPEAAYVTFEVSQDGGAIWSTLGSGTRVEGGWQLTGTSLPTSGILRATARVAADSSSSLAQTSLTYSGVLAPNLRVEQPTNITVSDDGSKQFTGQIIGQFTDLTFTLRNTGLADLTGISVLSSNPTEFQILTTPASSIAAGQTTTFNVRFAPASIGAKTSTMVISSNAPGLRNPYTITLLGNGITVPLATSNAASAIASTTAVMNGTVTARDDTASVFFQYRLASVTAWTTATATPASVSGFTATAVTGSLTGLTPLTAYQFRVGIYNSVTGAGSPVYGTIRNFSTV